MLCKISLFCNVPKEAVVEARTCSSIYHVPESLHEQGVDAFILKRLNLKSKIKFSNKWFKYVKQDTKGYKTVKIGVIGKYADLKDAYKSIDESLKISAMEAKVNVDVQYISSEDKNLIKLKDEEINQLKNNIKILSENQNKDLSEKNFRRDSCSRRIRHERNRR